VRMIGVRRAPSPTIVTRVGMRHQALMMNSLANWMRRLKFFYAWLWQPLTMRIFSNANELEEGGPLFVNPSVDVNDTPTNMRANPLMFKNLTSLIIDSNYELCVDVCPTLLPMLGHQVRRVLLLDILINSTLSNNYLPSSC
jgi:hypothetical protein